MTIITTDDEKAPLQMLTKAVEEACPQATICAFSNANEAYEYSKENRIDIAFLDIQMRQMSGLELAKKIQQTNPKVNVIFVTGFAEYGIDAVQLHASGYLEKPVDADDIRKAMENLLYPIEKKKAYIQTFGKFEFFYEGKPVKFERSKGKELLAYLVNLRGTSATRKEICAILFEEEGYTRTQQGYFTKIYKSLSDTLKKLGANDLLLHDSNYYAVNMNAFDSDLKAFMEGAASDKNTFTGSYMEQYSWAEEFVGEFIKEDNL